MASFVSSTPGNRYPSSYWQPAATQARQSSPTPWDQIPLRAWGPPLDGYYAPYRNPTPAHSLPAPALASRRGVRRLGCCALVGLGLAGACVLGGLVTAAVVLIRNHNATGAAGGGGGGALGGGVSGGGNSSALANTNLVAVPLTGCPSTDYSAPFIVGGQTFQLSIDSGSSTTGIASTQCVNCQGVSPAYSPSSSATSVGETAQSTYGDGSGWSGTIYTDSMSAADNATTSIPMNIVAITQQNSFFGPSGCSLQGAGQGANQGIAGFGPADLELPGTNDFVLKWAAATQNPAAFTFAPCDIGGSLWFGGYNPNAATQTPQFVPMAAVGSSNPYYAVNVDSMKVGDAEIVSSNSALGATLMDTGTSLFLLPQNVYDGFVNALSNNAAFANAFPNLLSNAGNVVTVSNGMSRSQLDQSLPPLVVNLDNGNGGVLTLTLPATSSYLLPFPTHPGDGHAGGYALGLAPQSGGPAIFGGGSMRALMVVFDPQNGQMGFAPQGPCKGNLA